MPRAPLALIAVLHATSLAQIAGTIAGTTDPNGAPVASATVVVTCECGIQRSSATAHDGSYKVTNVPLPGLSHISQRGSALKAAKAQVVLRSNIPMTADFSRELPPSG